MSSSSSDKRKTAHIIPRTTRSWHDREWQRLLAESFTDPAALFDYLKLDRAQLPAALEAAARFSLRVPRGFADLMEPGNLNDPLLRQALPLADELDSHPGYVSDPVGDLQSCATPGLLQKYHGRSLIITTAACAINCRYCFRRHFPYREQGALQHHWPGILSRLSEDASQSEVILSGGDPLMLSDDRLARMISDLEQMPHVRRLRFHTRLPVVLAERITVPLVRRLADSRFSVAIVLHVNHPRELSGLLRSACAELRAEGIALLNQSVLLKGVNADADTLSELSESLFEAGILPYYLHTLDPVAGAAHFDTGLPNAIRLHRQLLKRLPGYLVPKLVKEVPGEASKTPVI